MNAPTTIDSALACVDNDFLRALSEPVRIEILKLLMLNGACDVGTLANQMPQDRSVISRHLSLMHKAGMLNTKKEGRHKIYSIDSRGLLGKAENFVNTLRQCIALGCC